MKFSIKNFFSKCDQIRSFLRNWSYLLKKSLMENFIFWAVSEFSLYSKIRQFNEKRKQETTRFREFFLKVY